MTGTDRLSLTEAWALLRVLEASSDEDALAKLLPDGYAVAAALRGIDKLKAAFAATSQGSEKRLGLR